MHICWCYYVQLCTFRWLKSMFMFAAPSNRMDIGAGSLTPVIIAIAPVVKMYQHFTVPRICDGSHAYQGRILTIFCLELHSNLKQWTWTMIACLGRSWITSIVLLLYDFIIIINMNELKRIITFAICCLVKLFSGALLALHVDKYEFQLKVWS